MHLRVQSGILSLLYQHPKRLFILHNAQLQNFKVKIWLFHNLLMFSCPGDTSGHSYLQFYTYKEESPSTHFSRHSCYILAWIPQPNFISFQNWKPSHLHSVWLISCSCPFLKSAEQIFTKARQMPEKCNLRNNTALTCKEEGV